jgi:hypothetical protein
LSGRFGGGTGVKADLDLDGEILVTTATIIGRIPIVPRVAAVSRRRRGLGIRHPRRRRLRERDRVRTHRRLGQGRRQYGHVRGVPLRVGLVCLTFVTGNSLAKALPA